MCVLGADGSVCVCAPAEGAVPAHVTVSALHDHLALTVRVDAELNTFTASIFTFI